MGMFEIINLMSSKNGDELFQRVANIFVQFDISVYKDDGSVKDLYEVCDDIVEVLNKGK